MAVNEDGVFNCLKHKLLQYIDLKSFTFCLEIENNRMRWQWEISQSMWIRKHTIADETVAMSKPEPVCKALLGKGGWGYVCP